MSTIKANTVQPTTTNSDLTLNPDGTGDVVIDGLTWPSADGSPSQYLQTDGAGALSFATVTAPALEFVSSVTASASATVAFTNMVSGYDYEYVCHQVLPATDAQVFKAEVGIAGPTYRTSNYENAGAYISQGGTSVGHGNTTFLPLSAAFGVGSASGEGVHRLEVKLSDPAASGTLTSYNWNGSIDDGSPDQNSVLGGGVYLTAEAHTSIKFYFASGNVASGTIYQFRRANS